MFEAPTDVRVPRPTGRAPQSATNGPWWSMLSLEAVVNLKHGCQRSIFLAGEYILHHIYIIIEQYICIIYIYIYYIYSMYLIYIYYFLAGE